MLRPLVSLFAEEVYARLGPVAEASGGDESRGWHLLHLVQSISLMFARVGQLARSEEIIVTPEVLGPALAINRVPNPRLASAAGWSTAFSAGIVDLGSGWGVMPDGSGDHGWHVRGQQPNDAVARFIGVRQATGTANYMPAVPGETITVSADFFTVDDSVGLGMRMGYYWYDAGGTLISSAPGPTVQEVLATRQRVSAVTTPAPALTAFLRIEAVWTVNTPNDVIDGWVTFARAGQDATYFDGATRDFDKTRYSWTGTPDASTSTRSLVVVAARTRTAPPWRNIVDVDSAETEDLPYVGQMIGSRPLSGQTDAQARARIHNVDGFKRGRTSAIIGSVAATLTGTAYVGLVERAGLDAYALQVSTRTSETPSPANSLAAAIAAKPAGLGLTFTVTPNVTWGEMEARNLTGTYATVEAQFATYATAEATI